MNSIVPMLGADPATAVVILTQLAATGRIRVRRYGPNVAVEYTTSDQASVRDGEDGRGIYARIELQGSCPVPPFLASAERITEAIARAGELQLTAELDSPEYEAEAGGAVYCNGLTEPLATFEGDMFQTPPEYVASATHVAWEKLGDAVEWLLPLSGLSLDQEGVWIGPDDLAVTDGHIAAGQRLDTGATGWGLLPSRLMGVLRSAEWSWVEFGEGYCALLAAGAYIRAEVRWASVPPIASIWRSEGGVLASFSSQELLAILPPAPEYPSTADVLFDGTTMRVRTFVPKGNKRVVLVEELLTPIVWQGKGSYSFDLSRLRQGLEALPQSEGEIVLLDEGDSAVHVIRLGRRDNRWLVLAGTREGERDDD